MAITFRSRFLGAMRESERRMVALFNRLAAAAASEVTRRADGEGQIPQSATFEIQEAVGRLVTNMFLGRDRSGQRAPFEVLADGSVFPLSPFMRSLWTGIEAATRVSVEQHARLMRRRLPPELVGALQRARTDPFAVARDTVREQVVFRPNPLAQYEPAHTWVDPAGHTLSERIWNTAGNTRRRLDLFLERNIAEGRGALEISRDLETFLQPGRRLRRTRIYGQDASFDAMRLARTEMARAHAVAGEMSAAMNPFVQALEWTLSDSHPKPDICDVHAANGPYPIGQQPTMPAHPHDMCYWKYVTVEDPQAILDEARADIRRTRKQLVDKVGPIRVEQFVQLLLRTQRSGEGATI